MEADINGPQRKTLMTRVRPVKATHGTEGIALKDGATLPFEVYRSWSAPAGHYPEQWFLVDPKTKEVLYESRAVTRSIFGLQAPTDVTDVVEEPFDLAAGTYQIVFALGGLKGGEVEVVVAAADASAA
jgi:hypothetical protein